MNVDDDDDLVLTPPEGVGDDETDPDDDQHDANQADDVDDSDSEDDGLVVEFDGEDEGADETPLIKQLRQELRETKKQLHERDKPTKAKIEVGEKPTLDTCEYDEERFEAELDAWKERKRQAETQEQEEERETQARAERDQKAFISYRTRAATLPVKDFEQAEQAVINTLPELHSRALLHYTKDPAKLVYALHQNPQKMERIAQEPDVIKAILMMNELEGKMKVTTRKKPPAPESESIQRGSAAIATNSEKQLEMLEKEAERSGDRSKVVAYKAALRNAA